MIQGSWPLLTPLVPQLRELCSFLMEDRYNNGLDQVPFDTHALSRDNRVLIESETRKDTLTQGDKPAQTMWVLYLLVGSVPGPRLVSMQQTGGGGRGQAEGGKTASMRLPSPTLMKQRTQVCIPSKDAH